MVGFVRLGLAFMRRDILNALSYRANVLLNVISLGSYLLVFFFVGRLFSGIGSTYLAKYGGKYLPFVLIGLVMEAVAGAALGGFNQAIGNEQYLGTLEPLLNMGGRRAGPFNILTAAAIARNVMASWQLALYLIIGIIFFGVRYNARGIPLFLLALGLTAAAYFGLGMLSAAYTLVYKQGNPVNLVFGRLALLLSGVFFPVEVLPAWVRGAAGALPLTHGLNVARQALLGIEEGAGSGPLLFLAVFGAVSLGTGVAAFRGALNKARRDGTLGQY